jgi:hypothetical protein
MLDDYPAGRIEVIVKTNEKILPKCNNFLSDF